MSAAEEMRTAAAQMKERASVRGVPEGRWFYVLAPSGETHVLAPSAEMPALPWNVARDVPNDDVAAHIASWHPAVALAVAHWLESVANDVSVDEMTDDYSCVCYTHALAVARAFLGGAA